MRKIIGGLLIAATMLTPIVPAAARKAGGPAEVSMRDDAPRSAQTGERQRVRGPEMRTPRAPSPQRQERREARQEQRRETRQQWTVPQRQEQRERRQADHQQRQSPANRNWNFDQRRGDDNAARDRVVERRRQAEADRRPGRAYDRNRDGNLDRRWDRNDNNRLDQRERRYDRNRDGQIDRRYDRNNNERVDRRWNRNWRDDNRYNWRDYRRRYSHRYNLAPYYSPYRGRHYTRFSIGFNLGSLFYSSRYWINDPWQYRLPPAYEGYRWVRYYDDAILVDTYSGEVVDVIYNFFW